MNCVAVVRVQYLAEQTGLPAPTVVLLRETLVAAGYVRKLGRLAGYSVTGKVAALAQVITGYPRCSIARARRPGRWRGAPSG